MILSPGLTVVMIAGAIKAIAGDVLIWEAYIIAVIPVAVFIFICVYLEPSISAKVAGFMCVLYAVSTMVIVVGALVQISNPSLFTPYAVYVIATMAIYIATGVFHPQEILCVLPLPIYLLLLPARNLVFTFFAICNVQDMDWGVREDVKLMSQKMREESERQADKIRDKMSGIFEDESRCCGLSKLFKCGERSNEMNETMLTQILLRLSKLEEGDRNGFLKTLDPKVRQLLISAQTIEAESGIEVNHDIPETPLMTLKLGERAPESNANPAWINHETFEECPVTTLGDKEEVFWKQLIKKYLKPIFNDEDTQKAMATGLKEMRSKFLFGIIMANVLWLNAIIMIQSVEQPVKDSIYINVTLPGDNRPLQLEPIGLGFLFFFLAITVVQFLVMLLHRYDTLLQILAFTKINLPCWAKNRVDESKSPEEAPTKVTGDDVKKFVQLAKTWQRLRIEDPSADYENRQNPIGGNNATDTDNKSPEYSRKVSHANALSEAFSQRFNTYRRRVEETGGDVQNTIYESVRRGMPRHLLNKPRQNSMESNTLKRLRERKISRYQDRKVSRQFKQSNEYV
ncbi:unnamed protein product [Owenia fusiformis]|uniref:Chitin synthase 1 n=1 Tax=Owenia fusiformis TaxID=6347 RepID=A0A8S4PV08_OWEFU|nr:unnamed protein product [Owenia fusiformis]